MKTQTITRPKSQKEAVIAQLQRKGKINTYEAFDKFGITRLSGYIFNLKKEGFKFRTERKTGKSKYGFSFQYVEYVTKTR